MEYIVHYQMCDECHRREAKDFWRAVVQVRQKVGGDNCRAVEDYCNDDVIVFHRQHTRKHFFYLEQLILKYHAHNHALRIKESHDGIDFFYAGKQEARKMVDFLQTVVPCRYGEHEIVWNGAWISVH